MQFHFLQTPFLFKIYLFGRSSIHGFIPQTAAVAGLYRKPGARNASRVLHVSGRFPRRQQGAGCGEDPWARQRVPTRVAGLAGVDLTGCIMPPAPPRAQRVPLDPQTRKRIPAREPRLDHRERVPEKGHRWTSPGPLPYADNPAVGGAGGTRGGASLVGTTHP